MTEEFWFLLVPRLAELEWNVVVHDGQPSVCGTAWSEDAPAPRACARVCVCSSVSAGLDRCPEQPLTRSAASPATGLSAR